MRDACGSKTYPDLLMFIQVYRHFFAYSLILSSRANNISEETLLETIVSMQDIIEKESNERKIEMKKKIDSILRYHENKVFKLEH